jgi:transcriptional regulator with XRE-family HTH domain
VKDRIKAVRESNNMNRTRFAEKLNTSVAAISRYESGDRIPSDAILKLISKEFNVSFAWLKTGEGPMEDISDDSSVMRVIETYQALPDRLRSLVDALAEMDPEWYKTLDEAFAELERRKRKGDA